MNFATPLFLFVVVALAAEPQPGVLVQPRLTERQVLDIATPKLSERFPNVFNAHQPYRAQFSNGNWSVLGTVSKGIRGGGAPEATVRDSDGKILRMSLSR